MVWAVSEERLSRRKHQAGFPALAVTRAQEIISEQGGVVGEVAVAERAGRAVFRLFDGLYRRSSPGGPLGRGAQGAAGYSAWMARRAEGLSARASSLLLGRRLAAMGIEAPLRLVDHHDCHAWTAAAGAEDALVITMDAFGDGVSGGVYRATAGARPSMTRVWRTPAPHGPAILYGAVTQMLGFAEGDEGKVVARAADGDPERLRSVFESALSCKGGRPRLERPLRSVVAELAGHSPEDIAAGLQAHVERIVLAVLREAIAQVGGARLRLAGGLFANVALNRVVAEHAVAAGMTDVFVFPAMGDSGLCVGAAMAAEVAHGGSLGPFTDARCGDQASSASRSSDSSLPPDSTDAARAALLDGQVVGRCAGRMEFGPRALGARSFLFRAHDPSIGASLNAALGRDPRMPFGPVVLAEDAPTLLRDWAPGLAPMTRFMTVALRATEAMARLAPGAVHKDGTTRAQVLHEADDPALHAMLHAMPERLLVNTSLNLHGQPIVCTPAEARATVNAVGATLLWQR